MKKNYNFMLTFSGWIIRLSPILAVLSLMVFVENWHWSLGLFSHFRIQYLIVSILLLIFSAIARHRVFIFLNAGLVLLNVCIIAYALSFVQDRTSNSGSHILKILSANVYSRNEDTSKLKALIEKISPDIIILLEVNRRWASELKSLRIEYPFLIEKIREDNFGISLYSRIELVDPKIKYFTNEIPFIETYLADHKVRLIAVHTLPPISNWYKTWRDEQMHFIAHKLKSEKPPTLVMGDFNDTPWTPNFHKSLKYSSAKLAGVKLFGGTWPSGLGLLGLHLDHAVVKDVLVNEFRVLNSIGSDHYPISLTLSTHFEE